MRQAFIAAQLLWLAQAALDAEADELRAEGRHFHHRLRPGLAWGASTLLALVALAMVVGGLT